MISQIIATGSYLPEQILKNEDLRQFPASAIPMIAAKTGVVQRRHAAESQCTSDLAAEAARRCLTRAGIGAMDLDGIILATSSPDQPIPATSAVCRRSWRLGTRSRLTSTPFARARLVRFGWRTP